MCYCLCWSLRWWHIPYNLPYLFKQTKRTLYLLCYNLHLRWPWNFLVKFPLQFLKHSWICFLVGVFKTTYNKTKLQWFYIFVGIVFLGGWGSKWNLQKLSHYQFKRLILNFTYSIQQNSKTLSSSCQRKSIFNYVHKNKTTLHQDFRSDCNVAKGLNNEKF